MENKTIEAMEKLLAIKEETIKELEKQVKLLKDKTEAASFNVTCGCCANHPNIVTHQGPLPFKSDIDPLKVYPIYTHQGPLPDSDPMARNECNTITVNPKDSLNAIGYVSIKVPDTSQINNTIISADITLYDPNIMPSDCYQPHRDQTVYKYKS